MIFPDPLKLEGQAQDEFKEEESKEGAVEKYGIGSSLHVPDSQGLGDHVRDHLKEKGSEEEDDQFGHGLDPQEIDDKTMTKVVSYNISKTHTDA